MVPQGCREGKMKMREEEKMVAVVRANPLTGRVEQVLVKKGGEGDVGK